MTPVGDAPTPMQERTAWQFGVVSSLCYPDKTSGIHPPDECTGRTHARTDGRKLTEVNVDWLNTVDCETRAVTILHEVTHRVVGGYGKGKCSHNPEFWKEFQSNFNKIQDSSQARSMMETVFAVEVGENFDWHRFKYRAVQSVSQVDRRSETTDERREKMAEAIGYDAYDQFENSDTRDWGVVNLVTPGVDLDTSVQANVLVPDKRYAAEYSDEELLSFLENCRNSRAVPLPLINTDTEDYESGRPQKIEDDGNWRVLRIVGTPCKEESKKALALRERLGLGYCGLDLERTREIDADVPMEFLPPSFEEELLEPTP